MVTYRRNRLPGGSYFFTLTLVDRSSCLLTERIEDLREAFRSVRRERPFTIDAMVVLPNHLHCIWRLPPGDADYSIRWREIKARFSRRVPAGESRTQGRGHQKERGIWQRRFWEHTLRDDRDKVCRHFSRNPTGHPSLPRERKIGDSYAFGGPRRPASATACAARGATAPTVTDAGSVALCFVSTRATARTPTKHLTLRLRGGRRTSLSALRAESLPVLLQ